MAPNEDLLPSERALFIVDGNWLLHRAFNAIPGLATRDGRPTGAVFGFAQMLTKLLGEHKPAYAAVVFDAPGPSFRHIMFPEYKSQRPPMPPELVEQIPLVHRLVDAFSVPRLSFEGVEADDVIATLARQAQTEGIPCVIVSGDKDLMQLVGDGITLFDTFRDVVYDRERVIDRWGVPPEKIVDLLALMGDASDGVPGLPGCGEKTARDLITRFGSVEGVIQGRDSVTSKKVREALHAPDAAEKLGLWKTLVTLRDHEPLDVSLESLRIRPPDIAKLEPLLRELEMNKLLRTLVPVEARAPEEPQVISDERELGDLLQAIREAGEFAFDLLTDRPEPMRASICGVAVAVKGRAPAYIPVAHRYVGAPSQLSASVVLGTLRPFLENPEIPKYVHNHKIEAILLGELGIELRGVRCDPMLASYLLDTARQTHSLEVLAQERLGQTLMTSKELLALAPRSHALDELEVGVAAKYGAEAAGAVLRLAPLLREEIEKDENVKQLHDDVELPLARILALMERHGVRVDTDHLGRLSREVGERLRALEAEIQQLAGYPLNVNSPKQLQELLFGRLGLPPKKRLKTGLSTDAEVLEELRDSHPVVGLILEYRELSKLKSTYIEALPALVNPTTGRVHTSFNQAVAATGRLSSSDPNLQNIPVRSDLGKEIRRAFVAEEGYLLVSADYSQIELRILAHLSGDAVLIDAFERDQDVHRRTASEVFGVPPAEVTPEQRSIAKTVNFGVIYGQGDFGLARQLGIDRDTARRYIESYFDRYVGVREFMERTVAQARETGIVTTLLGRKRRIPEIRSKNAQMRAYGERIARNTPIQGSAADLLKLAMIRMQQRLDANWPKVRMILTVHDELVFEVPAGDAEFFARLTRAEMEGVMELRVPLKVDVGIAPNWTDAHP